MHARSGGPWQHRVWRGEGGGEGAGKGEEEGGHIINSRMFSAVPTLHVYVLYTQRRTVVMDRTNWIQRKVMSKNGVFGDSSSMPTYLWRNLRWSSFEYRTQRNRSPIHTSVKNICATTHHPSAFPICVKGGRRIQP